MARYIVRARNRAGVMESQDALTIDVALGKAAALRDAEFEHITLVNTVTGVEITDLEELLQGVVRKT